MSAGKQEREGRRCALCARQVGRLTRHHVRPRQYGGTLVEELCQACHHQVHALFTNRTLAAELDTIAKLREDPQIQRYLAWARKQQDRHIPVRRSRSRR
jgi:5-methylcytosine-specific restriction protein A